MNQIDRPPRQMRIEAKKNQLKSPIMVANTVVYSNTFSTREGSETNRSILYLIAYDVVRSFLSYRILKYFEIC